MLVSYYLTVTESAPGVGARGVLSKEPSPRAIAQINGIAMNGEAHFNWYGFDFVYVTDEGPEIITKEVIDDLFLNDFDEAEVNIDFFGGMRRYHWTPALASTDF